MPLIYQYRIYRGDLRANQKVLYVFGDNTRRIGMGGQAGQMRGEANAIGVATKWAPDINPAAYFSDRLIEEEKRIIMQDLAPILTALTSAKIVVWPLEGIGSGLSQLPVRAPKLWDWLEETRKMLEQIP